MTLAWPAQGFAQPRVRWPAALATLVGTWAALLLLFSRDVGDLAYIYWNSTTFGHCLFVPPIIGWLVWQRREGLSQLSLEGWWPGLGAVAAGAACWFLGDIAAIAFGRHLGLVLLLQGTILAILGPQVGRALAFPIGYMLFLVPFGEWLERPLQGTTIAMVMPLLRLAGVPATLDGVLITIPNGYFEVAEACSGAKFVIAMVAYGALVANVCFVSPMRRAVFLAVALVVPVLANGLRAFGTIYAAHLTSVERATGFDHIVYGWVFFGMVMAAVVALGWRWFDRDPDAAWFDPAALQADPGRAIDGLTAAGLSIGLAVLACALGGAVAARADALPQQMRLPAVPGWHRVALSTTAPWTPTYPTADHQLIGRYADRSGHRVDLAVAVYDGQREGHEVVAFGQGTIAENGRWVRVEDEIPLQGGRIERITAPGPVERTVATWYRVGSIVTASERNVKIETLKAKLLGGPQRASAVHLSTEATGPAAREAIGAFLAAAGPPGDLADRIATGR